MRWMRTAASLCLGLLAAAVWTAASQQVALDRTAAYTCDPSGNLYLLSGGSTLSKVTAEGLLAWSLPLPTQGEDGISLRYGMVVSDRGGSVYVTRQDYRERINALGEREEVTLHESVLAFHGGGTEQDPVLTADLTTLSQHSAQPYILNLRIHGDSLLAVCHNQGQYEVIRMEPYGEQGPEVVSAILLDVAPGEIQDCTALSDGSLVYSTTGGGLFLADSQGKLRDLRPLVGADGLIGRLSADETDSVYCTELKSGTFYRIAPEDSTIRRVFSPVTVIGGDGNQTITFDQVRGVKALGDGAFCASSIDGRSPYWLRFDGDGHSFRHASARRGWDAAAVAGALGVLAVTALAAWLLGWLLGRLQSRNRLAGRILRDFLPVLLLILIATGVLSGSLAMLQEEENWTLSLAAAARTAARLTPAGQLKDISPAAYGPSEREAFIRMAEETAAGAVEVSGFQDLGLVFYTMEEEPLCVYATLERDQFYNAEYLSPLARELPAGTVDEITACAQAGGSVVFYRDEVDYLGWFQPVRDDSGRIVGLVEARAQQFGSVQAVALAIPVYWMLAAGVLIVVWLLLVMGRSFRPLRELGRCINAISAGNWNVKARIKSHDELAEIGGSFNQMTEKLGQYISSMVLLNNEYIKFTPRELFQLMGKTKVTDLRLGDKSVREVSLLYVGLQAGDGGLDSEGCFALMNESFDQIFQVVERNHGVIQRFDGSGITVLFPGRVWDALNAAISLKELMARGGSALELNMLISSDETLVGVAGNEKRQTITALSPAILDIYALTSLMEELGTRYAITRQALEKISGGAYFNCREIGSGLSGRDTLFEFLDGMDPYEKKLHLVTREEFERGVHDFQAGRYSDARKHFAAVLQINERDQVAMYYLLRCGRAGEVTAVEC